MKIRLANKNDIEEICKLYNEFFIYNSDQQPQYYKTAIEKGTYPESVVESNTEDIYVAVETNNIIGLVHMVEAITPPYDCFVQHRYASIIDLFVTKNYRNKGAGGLLLESAKEWAKARRLDYIELNVLTENKNGIQFYNNQEFKPVSHIMRFTL
ncbi:MAG TPA: GNAT family N-acetyltransferase [Oscillospiraceae bacterium]|nr:GNAT family N-acetyltransferase [Oscillospiraceae bacterium]